MRPLVLFLLVLGVIVGLLREVRAQDCDIAVFGNNLTEDFINSDIPGCTATLVSDAQIASGILATGGFEAFYLTRLASNFGQLSELATNAVRDYVGSTGNVVLLNCDCADAIFDFVGEFPPDPNVERIAANAIQWAAASGHGFIGEFNGAVSGLTSNSNGFNPLSLVDGSAGPLAARGRSTFSELRWYPPMEAAEGSLSWVFRAKQPESFRTGP